MEQIIPQKQKKGGTCGCQGLPRGLAHPPRYRCWHSLHREEHIGSSNLEQSSFCIILPGLRDFSLSLRVVGAANVELTLLKVASASGNFYKMYLFVFSPAGVNFYVEGDRKFQGLEGNHKHTKVLARVQTRLCDTCSSQARARTRTRTPEVCPQTRAEKVRLQRNDPQKHPNKSVK